MKYVWAVVTLLAGPFIVIAVEYPPGDGDLAWQRRLGDVILATHRIPHALGTETYTAAGSPWVPQEWLFSILAAVSLGSPERPLLALGITACALAAIVLTAYRAVRRGAQAIDAAAVAALTGVAMLSAFGVRAQVVAWAPFALMLLAVDNEGPWLWACVPIAAMWSNVHASAVLAPLLAGVVAVGRSIEDRAWTPRVSRACAVTCAVAAAICCNPLGVGLPLYAASLFFSPITSFIQEWKSIDVGDYAFSFGSLPVLLAAIFFGVMHRNGKRQKIEDILFFSVFTFLLFRSIRNVTLFAIAIAPLCACAFENYSVGIRKNIRVPAFVFPLAIVSLALMIAFETHTSAYRKRAAIPTKEIIALASLPGEHRLFCSDFSWCAYFLESANIRIFLDGRSDPYPLRIWEAYGNIAFLRPGWRDIVNAYHIDSIVDRRTDALDQAVALTNDWRDASHDEKFRLWVRK